MSKLLQVQILRALAALSIAVLHAQHDAAGLAARLGRTLGQGPSFPWVAGVDVFFVISGFIMVYASRRLFGTAGGRGVFLAHRIARVVPLYWAVTTLYLAVALAVPTLVNAERPSPVLVAASYLFVPVMRADGVVQPLYGLGWTLNYEMFFYALFAVAVGFPRRTGLPLLLAALASLVAVGVALFPTLPATLAFWTDPILLEFAFGLVLGLLRESGVRLASVVRLALALVGVALLGLDLVGPPEAEVMPRPLGYGIPAALLIAAAALGRDRDREAGPLTRAAVAVGDASYALYLVHPFVIRAARELVLASGLAPLVAPWAFVVLSLALATAAAVAVHFAFERPMTAWVRRKLETLFVSLPEPGGMRYGSRVAAPPTARGDTDTRASP